MTGYLGRLVDRALGRALVLQPRLPSRFDPGRLGAGPRPEAWSAHDEESAAGGTGPARPLHGAAAPPPAAPPRAGEAGPERPAPAAAPAPPAAASGARLPLDRSLRPAPAAPREDATEGADAGLPARLRGAAEAVDALLAEVRRERAGSLGPPAGAEPARPVRPGEAPVIALERRPPEGPATGLEREPPAPRLAAPPPLHSASRSTAREAARAQAAVGYAAPAIHVTIGRVEVRAAAPDGPAAPAPAPRRAAPALALHDYLRRRDGGGR